MARVLVVDDDPKQLALRQRLIETERHHVRTAPTAEGAVRELAEFRPHVLVMDLGLPGVEDGMALIRAAAAAECAPRILVLSGWPQQLEGRAEASFVARVMPKPAPARALLAAVRELGG